MSSVNLGNRLAQYFNYNHMTRRHRNMIIYKALLKYGYSEFILEILEYCSLEELIVKEQFYMNKFSPEFNILKVAGSSLGFKHSEATKELMSQLAKGRKIKTIIIRDK